MKEEIAESIFFEFMKEIEDTQLYSKYIIEVEDGTASTEEASDLLERIEGQLDRFEKHISVDKTTGWTNLNRLV
tara:strand:- start:431 stop:652 length:222 start_codon:yes stop_codon:yes gene_type:complete